MPSTHAGVNHPVKEVIVASYRVDCVGVGPQTCYLYKENQEDEWKFFYSEISGLDYEPGYEYVIKVQVKVSGNDYQDASDYDFELIEVVSKTRDTKGMSPLTDTWGLLELNGVKVEYTKLTKSPMIDINTLPAVNEWVQDFGLVIARQAALFLGAARIFHREAVRAHDFLGQLLAAKVEVARVDNLEILQHRERGAARADVDDGDRMSHAPIGKLVTQQLARILERKRLNVHDVRHETCRIDGCLPLFDVLGARGNEQNVHQLRVFLVGADNLEIEADLFHWKGYVLVRLDFDLALEISCGEP